jgi:CO/xanthine dehydrogenase Mo-binding subunit
VVDPGVVVNPLQLRRIIEGGAVMGMSEVLNETTAFNRGMITSADWVTYPIMRIVDMPAIKVVVINNLDVGAYLGAGESPNAMPYVAIPAAFLDATGKFPRSLPLRPANVRAILQD